MRLVCQFAIAFCLSFPATGMTTERQEPAEPAPSSAQAQTPPAAKESAPEEQAPPATPPDAANSQTPAGAEKTGEAAKKQTNTASTISTRKRHKHPGAPEGTPRKVVVREGGASEPASRIAPDITPAEAAHQRQNAEQLLGSTDEQLKRLAGRTFDAGRQETVGQIRNYMDDARSALKEGDVGRANTLAKKAHLLADDLVKH